MCSVVSEQFKYFKVGRGEFTHWLDYCASLLPIGLRTLWRLDVNEIGRRSEHDLL